VRSQLVLATDVASTSENRDDAVFAKKCRVVVGLRGLGFSLVEIQEDLGQCDGEAGIFEWLQRQKDRVSAKIQEASRKAA